VTTPVLISLDPIRLEVRDPVEELWTTPEVVIPASVAEVADKVPTVMFEAEVNVGCFAAKAVDKGVFSVGKDTVAASVKPAYVVIPDALIVLPEMVMFVPAVNVACFPASAVLKGVFTVGKRAVVASLSPAYANVFPIILPIESVPRRAWFVDVIDKLSTDNPPVTICGVRDASIRKWASVPTSGNLYVREAVKVVPPIE
jgi:hypothetical protein